MKKLRTSGFQFKRPQLMKLLFEINREFNPECFATIVIEPEVNIHKNIDENIAFVSLELNIGGGGAPFQINIQMGSDFRWNDSIDKSIVDDLLSTNAPALLLGYMRPIVSMVTSNSIYPDYDIPYIDFRKPIEETESEATE